MYGRVFYFLKNKQANKKALVFCKGCCKSVRCDWNSGYKFLGINREKRKILGYISQDASQLWVVSGYIGEIIFILSVFSSLSSIS